MTPSRHITSTSSAISIDALAARCARHNEAFERRAAVERVDGSPSDDAAACLMLFQLALAEADPRAWQFIVDAYTPRVASWARNHRYFAQSAEQADVFVNGAFARLWRHGSAHFAAGRFTSLGATLQYLKMCVWSELQQHQRKHAALRQREIEWVDPDEIDVDAPPEAFAAAQSLAAWMLARNADTEAERALDDILARVRALVDRVIETETERVACDACWRQGIAPRVVSAKHPGLFADAASVSQALRNVLRRVRRHPETAALLDSRSKSD
jgi:hypothetical protein